MYATLGAAWVCRERRIELRRRAALRACLVGSASEWIAAPD